MSTTLAPPTPPTLAPQTVVSDAPPGTWRHPRFDEIQQRLQASTFGERNIKALVSSLLVFFLSFFIPFHRIGQAIQTLFPNAYKSLHPYWDYLVLSIHLLPLLSAIYALAPLWRPKDDLADIPLTPSQRALLGLEPTSTPATPGSQYITPPKYSKSSTPRSRSQSGSPYSSGRDSTQSLGGYSPNNSPLFQKAVGRDVTRRLSYGSPSPLSLSKTTSDSSGSLFANTPSPTTGRGASVGLNSRWLYEKRRSSSGLKSMYS